MADRSSWVRAIASARGRANARSAPPAAPQAMLDLRRSGPSPLAARSPREDALEVAVLIPSFRRGSGGHATIVHLAEGLRGLGHTVSLWLEDWEGRHRRERASLTRSSFEQFFSYAGPPLHTDFAEWRGADVVLATGWQTVARALLLEGAAARAYLVQDHEPDFYGASAESGWARGSYRQGLHCIAASEWLAELLRSRYGAVASHFDLALDHDVYRPRGERRSDLVVFYARVSTPRRAVPLGLLALQELGRRRPQAEIALFGEEPAPAAPFPHRGLGVLGREDLALLYSEAAVGMVLSLTNPSLISLEMMACGLPCVELASEPMRASFAVDGVAPMLAEADPLALADALERALNDAELRARASREGLSLVAARTWERAAHQVHAGLLEALGRARAQP